MKAIILDRDGTLIVDQVYLNDPTRIEYLPGVFEALRLLRDHRYSFFVATNQSGIARGLVDIANMDRIHDIVRAEFARNGVDIKSFYYAPYSANSGHQRRKPNPGMLQLAAQEHGIDLGKSWMIGDRASDVEAGIRAGARTILLKWPQHDIGENHPEATFQAAGLLEAARFIVSN